MDPKLLHAESEDSDQTMRMHWLIWVFAHAHAIVQVLLSLDSAGLWKTWRVHNFIAKQFLTPDDRNNIDVITYRGILSLDALVSGF